MNEAILRNHNEVVKPNDTVYVLGDLMLGDKDDESLELISRMNGYKIVILGNHDSTRRKFLYQRFTDEVYYATMLKYNGYHFYLSHYPTVCNNNDEDKPLKARILNIHGHTHSSKRFNEFNGFNICPEAHKCYPVLLDSIITAFIEN